MANLDPKERQSLRDFAKQQPLQHPPHPPLKIEDFLRTISQLPPSLSQKKPVRFTGKHWKL